MGAVVGDFLKNLSASGKMSLLDCFAHAAERDGKGPYGIEAAGRRNRRGNPRG